MLLCQWMTFCVDINSVIKSFLQTSRLGSGNPKEISGSTNFARSESSGCKSNNQENTEEHGQISALDVNGTLCTWG